MGHIGHMWTNHGSYMGQPLVMLAIRGSANNSNVMTAANMRKLEAAHHKWLRRILGITWKDRVTNEEVRKRTGMAKLEDTLRKSR